MQDEPRTTMKWWLDQAATTIDSCSGVPQRALAWCARPQHGILCRTSATQHTQRLTCLPQRCYVRWYPAMRLKFMVFTRMVVSTPSSTLTSVIISRRSGSTPITTLKPSARACSLASAPYLGASAWLIGLCWRADNPGHAGRHVKQGGLCSGW